MFLSTLTAGVGSARSTKAQTAAIETFTAVAPLLRNIGPAALRCTFLLSDDLDPCMLKFFAANYLESWACQEGFW